MKRAELLLGFTRSSTSPPATLVGRFVRTVRATESLSLQHPAIHPCYLQRERARNARAGGGERRRQRRDETAITVGNDRYTRRNRHPKAPTLLISS
eukprot:3046338-Prymnesium_polylepis.1